MEKVYSASEQRSRERCFLVTRKSQLLTFYLIKPIFSVQKKNREVPPLLSLVVVVYILLSYIMSKTLSLSVWESLSEPEPDLPQDPWAAPSPGQSAQRPQSGQCSEDQEEALQTGPGLPRQEPAPLHQQRPGQHRSHSLLVCLLSPGDQCHLTMSLS